MAERYPAGLLGGIGLAIFDAGLFELSLIRVTFDAFDIAWRMSLCGIGFGLSQSLNNRTMISAAPRERSGAAGGMLAAARLGGWTIGAVAVAAGLHWLGAGAAQSLLRFAAGAAVLAALISCLRLRATSPTTVPAKPEAET